MKRYECEECRAFFLREEMQRVQDSEGNYHIVCDYCAKEKYGKEDDEDA